MNKYFSTISLFFIIIDTGGWSNLRFLGLLFIMVSFTLTFNLKLIFKKNIDILLSFLLLLSILPSLFFPYLSNQDFSLGLSQVMPILIFPFLIIIIHLREKDYNEIVSLLTTVFSSVIIVFYLLRLFDIGFANSFAEHLDSAREAGFFDYKSNLLGIYLPVVYFKPTLLLVPLGLYCLLINKKSSFLLVMIALFIAPSRTGFIVLFLFFGGNYFMRASLFIKLTSLTLLFFLVSYISSYIDIENLIFGLSVRLGHLSSLMEMSFDYESLILGQGAGTSFYSYGFNSMTDGMELSQLEYIRRHGLLSFFFLFLIWAKAAYSNEKWRQPICAYWLVAMSNPVLAVFFSFTFLALILSKKTGN
jgi:hypothetical protein